MSSQSATTRFIVPPRQGEPGVRRRHPVLVFVQRVSPSQGWATFAILAVTLSIVSESITAAEWVDIPGLTSTMLLASLVGLGLAKIRVPWILMHIAGLALGALFILWKASSMVDGESLGDRMGELFDRLDVWYDAAVGGGISTDLLPFVMLRMFSAPA